MMNPVAVYTITNTCALALYEYNGEIALSGFIGMSKADKPKLTKVNYTASGRPYIVRYKTRYYLDTFMRV